jgi:hypothetical protein
MIQDEPRESSCKGVTPGAADALGLHRLCDRLRCPDVIEVLRGKPSGYQIRDTMNIRRGLARIAHDQAEHLTTPAILVQNGLERRRITKLVVLCIEFVSFLPVFGFDFSLSSTTPAEEKSLARCLKKLLHRYRRSPMCLPQ